FFFFSSRRRHTRFSRDWSSDVCSSDLNACKGPAGIDVGHCRVDMAQLHGVEYSDAFLTAYQKHAGELFLYDPYWDLIALIDILFGPPEVYLGWPALGVKGLTNEIIAHRLDEYMLSLLKRI